MAEREKDNKQNNSVQKPILGIEQNMPMEDKPSNFTTYALNALIESDEGNFVLSKENSNYHHFDFYSSEEPSVDFMVVGKIEGEDEYIYYFLASADGLHSEFGYVDKNNTYHTVVNLAALNFNIVNQISGVYRLRLGCEKTIYWVEQNANNPIRYFNFSKQDQFKDNSGNWSIDKFDLFYKYLRPNFDEIEVLQNGELPSGSYNVAIQLLDANLNATPWIYTTHPIPIYASNTGLNYYNVSGSSNVATDPLAGLPTNAGKSIKVTVSGIDEDFIYYRLALIEASSFTGNVTRVHTTNPIPSSQLQYTFSGNPTALNQDTTVQNIKDKFIPFTAEILEQQENRLIAAKIKGKQYDFCSFQKYASKIASAYTTAEADSTNINDLGNPKNPDTYWLEMSYQGWEVYAFGIVYVFPDFETPAYHIPGRPKNCYWDFNKHDYTVITGEGDKMPWNNGEVLPFSVYDNSTDYTANKDVERWQIRDTSSRTIGDTWGRMCYFENPDFEYPPKSDCDEDSDNGDYWGVDFQGNPLTGKPIRHHRFPSRFKEHQSKDANLSTEIKEILKIIITLKDPAVPLPAEDYTLEAGYDKETIAQTYTSPSIPDEDITSLNYTLAIDYSDNGPGAFTNIVITSFEDSMGVDCTSYVDITYEIYTVNNTVATATLNLLGVQFTNIEYPHPDIIGHYIVVANRDSFNRTVLDCGFAFPMRKKTTPKGFKYITHSYFRNNDTPIEVDLKTLSSFTPKFLMRTEYLKADYIRLENIIPKNGDNYLIHNNYDGSNTTFGKGTDIRLIIRDLECQDPDSTVDAYKNTIFPILKQKEFDAFSYDDVYDDVNDFRLYNLSWDNRILVNTVQRDFYNHFTNEDIPYVSYGVNRQIHTDLFNMTYYRTHPNMVEVDNTTDIHEVFGGDTFISQFRLMNGLFYDKQESVWAIVPDALAVLGALTAIALVIFVPGAGAALVAGLSALWAASATLAVAAATIVVGAFVAAGIGLVDAAVTYGKDAYENQELNLMVEDSEVDTVMGSSLGGNEEAYVMEGLFGAYVESEINYELRQDLINVNDAQNSCRVFRSEGMLTYFRDKFMVFNPDETDIDLQWTLRGVPYPEVYHYNPDYSRKNFETEYYSLSLSYDCCSECMEEFENRVHYSEQSFQEELVDHYRIFLPNNYRDIEGHYGGITNVFRRGSQLFIHTSEALWQLPTNYQSQATNDLVTYIGTGEFFSIPPMLILEDKGGICGSQHRWATTKSRFGTLFVNELERKIYLLGESPKVLNLEGIKNWSEEEIPLLLDIQWLQWFDTKYPLTNNPYNPNGIGFISIFDNKYNRFLITKKDFRILADEVFLGTVTYNEETEIYVFTEYVGEVEEEDLVYSDGQFYIISDIDRDVYVTPISFTGEGSEVYFENKSWTISYSQSIQNWVSWHSYIPDIYTSTQNSFFSIINSVGRGRYYEHNWKNDYCNFYRNNYSHIVEFYFNNPLQNFVWDSLQLHVKARKYDSTRKTYIEEVYGFFDEVIFYNDRQCSGIKTISVKDTNTTANCMLDSIVEDTSKIRVSKKEGIWYMNEIRDFIVDYTEAIFSKDWADIYTDYPIDKVVNPNVIDHNKDWKTLELLRGKFLSVRLISKTTSNNRDLQLLTSYSIKFNNPSYR